MSDTKKDSIVIPSGYTRLKYIVCNGTQYVDTGFHADQSTDYDVTVMPEGEVGFKTVLGARTSTSSKRFDLMFGYNSSSSLIDNEIYFGYNNGSANYISNSSFSGEILNLVKSANTLKIYKDKELLTTLSRTTATFETPVNLTLCADNTNGTLSNYFIGRIYGMVISEVANYIPCMNSDGVPGLFDTISWSFITSDGDPFEAGPEYNYTIAEKLGTVLSGVEDIRVALSEYRNTLGKDVVTTLGDDVRAIRSGGGAGFQLNGEVRHSEEVEVEVEDPETGDITTETVTEYTYPVEEIFNGSLIDFTADYIWTDVIDNLGELTATTVLSNGNVQFTLDTGIKLTVDPTKTYIRFKDPVVENIIVTNWGTDGKISLAVAREITGFNKAFADNTEIKYFNEFKYFDNIDWPISYPNNNSNQRTATSNEGLYGMFSGCSSLEEIKLSPNHTSLGFRAFFGCSSLKKLDLPDGFLNLGAGYLYTTGYFHGCTSLEELIMPDSILQVGTDLFDGCTSLKKVRWSSNVKFNVTTNTNGGSLFKSCTSLETIENFPQSLTQNKGIKYHDFYNCSKLDYSCLDGVLEDSSALGSYALHAKVFDDHDGYLRLPECTSLADNALRYEGTAFSYMNTIDLPKMTSVYMRYNYLALGKVILNEDVTEIRVSAFLNNDGLCEVLLPAETPPTLSGTSGFNDSQQCTIYVPSDSVGDYKAATNWSSTSAQIVKRIYAYKDPSTATFCEIPSIAPVPVDYTRMSWIGGGIDKNGTYQHGEINLDYAPSKYAHLLMDVNLVSSANTTNGSYAGHYCAFLGATDYIGMASATTSSNITGVVLHVINNANPICLYQISNDGKPRRRWAFNPLITGEPFFDKRTMLKINRSFIQFHGETHQKIEQDNDWAYPIRLFGWRTGPSSGARTGTYSKSYIKMYRFCIFEPVAGTTDFDDVSNYEIVRDYIPCMRNSDGRYGVWERMTGAFFTTDVTTNPYNVIGSMED